MSTFETKVGSTLPLLVCVYTSDSYLVPFSLVDRDVVFYAADRAVSPTVEVNKSLGSGVAISDPRSGVAVVTVNGDDTSLFGDSGGILLFTISLVDGSDSYPLQSGKILIRPRLP